MRPFLLFVRSHAAGPGEPSGEGTVTRLSWRSLPSGVVEGAVDVPLSACLSPFLSLVEESVGSEALFLTRGPRELRSVLHPHAAKDEIRPSSLFLRYVDAGALSGRSFPEEEVDQMREMEEAMGSFPLEAIEAAAEEIKLGFDVGVCEAEAIVEDSCIARARGLPWQATDAHVAQFFAGLNITPGGIALCLSTEGRRNGEAVVRFETPEHRELALRRHRHFLLARYIEVYRATAEDFLAVAAGSSSEAVDFVSRGAGMIVRMRGLPFDATEDNIRQFFSEVGVSVMEAGVLFVNRPDGRPTGDSFVLFSTEAEGQKALSRHRHTIGSRYVELFRSSHAEVQQVVKRNTEGGTNAPQGNTTGRRDCIRMRGLPYEARVDHVVDFLGVHAGSIAPQGVHMVFNSQGHPSGEAFIQLTSEAAAHAIATSTHNKFMAIGKKQRYIEVFQCSPEEMNVMVAAPRPVASLPTPPAPAPPLILPPGVPPPPHPRLFPNVGLPLGVPPQFWPYPSPPVSPNMLLNTSGQLLVTGLGVHVTPADIVAHFSSSPDTVVECVEMLRWPSASTPGEALVRLRPRDLPLPSLPLPSLPSALPFSLIHT